MFINQFPNHGDFQQGASAAGQDYVSGAEVYEGFESIGEVFSSYLFVDPLVRPGPAEGGAGDANG